MISRTTCAVPVCFLLLGSPALAQDAVDLAASLIGRPYVWGAEGPNAFDCSGLTQFVYREFGIVLPRRAISQSRIGDAAGRRLQRGDLLFFSTDSSRSLVTHVGLYEGHGVMIDASKRGGRVQRDNLEDPFWIERFMFGRRVTDWDGGGDVEQRRPSSRNGESAVRVIERIADILLKRPRR